MALSLGSPPPDVIRHRMSMEPGLSSPVKGAAVRPTDLEGMGFKAARVKALVPGREGKIIIMKLSFDGRSTRLVVGDGADQRS